MLEFAVIREKQALLTKLEIQGYKKKILEKAFVKFYRNHYDEMWIVRGF